MNTSSSVRKLLPQVLGLFLPIFLMTTLAGASVLSLDDCVRMGIEGNLTLQMQRLQLSSASAEVQAVSAVYDPRFSLSGNYQDSELPPGSFPAQGGLERGQATASLGQEFSSGTRLGVEFDLQRNLFEGMSAGNEPMWRTAAGLSIRQSIWRNAFGGANEARVDYARQRIISLELEYERAIEQVAAAIRDEYWRAFTAREIAETQQAVIERLAKLLESNKRKFEEGLLDESAVLAVEASLSVAEVEVEVLKHEALSIDERLKERINLPVAQWNDTAIDYRLPPDASNASSANGFAEVYAQAMLNRADVEALRREEKRVESLIELRELEDRGDVQLTGSIGRGDSDVELGDSMDFDKTVWSVGAILDFSLKRSVSRAALTQAFLERERIRTQMEMLQRSIELECRNAIRQLTTASRLVEAARKSRDLQARKLELENARYDRGQSDINTILDYQNDLEAAERDWLKSQGALQRAEVALKLVQGLVVAGDQP